MYPMLNSNYKLKVFDDNLYVYSNNKHFEISGASVTGLYALLNKLNGKKTVEQLSEEVQLSVETISDALKKLEQQGVVTFFEREVSLGQSGIGRYRSFFDSIGWTDEANQIQVLLQKKHIVVVGPAVVTEPLSAQLAHVEAQFSVLESPEDLVNSDVMDTGKDVFLAGLYPGENSQFFSRIDRFAKDYHLEWMKVVLNGLEVTVGPIFIPGGTGCYECYKARLVTNSPQPEIEVQFLSEKGNDIFDSPPGTLSMVSGLAMLELVKHLLQYEPSILVGSEYVTNLLSLDAEIKPLWKLPSCAFCATEQPGSYQIEVKELKVITQ